MPPRLLVIMWLLWALSAGLIALGPVTDRIGRQIMLLVDIATTNASKITRRTYSTVAAVPELSAGSGPYPPVVSRNNRAIS